MAGFLTEAQESKKNVDGLRLNLNQICSLSLDDEEAKTVY